MKLDEKSKAMKRMMDSMRALTEAEMTERQRLTSPRMQNSEMRHVPGTENMWATNIWHWMPDKPKQTFWGRMKRLFVMPNKD